MDVSSRWPFLVVAAGMVVALAYRRSRREESDSRPAPAPAPAPAADVRVYARSFGSKGAWIAAKGVSSRKVADALHLATVSPASWEDGLRAAYDPDPLGRKHPSPEAARKAELAFPETSLVFVGAPVKEWTLAVGQRLAFFDSFAFKNIPANHHTKDLLPFVEALSKELGTVQYFFTHRVPETHIWVWAESGRIVRAYGYSGERDSVLFDVGPPTAGEKVLRLAIPPSETTPNEQTVVEVAGRWSIDPTKLDDEQVEGPGVLGTMP